MLHLGPHPASHHRLLAPGRAIVVATLLGALTPSVSPAQEIDRPWKPDASAKERLPAPAERLSQASQSDRMWRLPPVEPQFWRLAEIEELALANNPSLARAAANVEIARGDWLQRGLFPNPTVGLGQQQTGSRGLAEQDNVSFSQEFVLGGKLRRNRAVAAQDIVRAQQQHAAQQLRVVTDARIAFYHVLIAQRQRRLADSLVQIAQSNVRAAKELNPGNEMGANDVLEAQVELYNAEIQARKSGNRYAAAWQSLCAVAGDRHLPFRELEGNLEPMVNERSWPETLERIQQSSPEVAAAIAQLERARAALERAAVEKIPNVTFDGLVNWRDNGIGGRPDGGVQVSLPLPVWDRNQGGVLQAQGEVAAAARAIGQLELDLQNRLASVFERYTNARFQVVQYRDLILPASAKALEFTRKNYDDGKVDYDDLLTSQRTNAQANFDYLESLRELWIAEAELEGMLLSGSLAGQ